MTAATSGKLGQCQGGTLCVFIDDPSAEAGGRDTLVANENRPICTEVDECSFRGSVASGTAQLTPQGRAGAMCSEPDLDLPLSAEQISSVLAAFPSGNPCGVRLAAAQPDQLSSLVIRLEQSARSRGAP